MIPTAKIMSEMVAPFTVLGQLTGEQYKIRFSHLWVGMTTRHADTIDCKFLVNGRGVIVGLAHLGFVDFQERAGRPLNDQEAAHIAALFLKQYFEDDHTLPSQPLDVPREEVLRLADKLGLPAAPAPNSSP